MEVARVPFDTLAGQVMSGEIRDGQDRGRGFEDEIIAEALKWRFAL